MYKYSTSILFLSCANAIKPEAVALADSTNIQAEQHVKANTTLQEIEHFESHEVDMTDETASAIDQWRLNKYLEQYISSPEIFDALRQSSCNDFGMQVQNDLNWIKNKCAHLLQLARGKKDIEKLTDLLNSVNAYINAPGKIPKHLTHFGRDMGVTQRANLYRANGSRLWAIPEDSEVAVDMEKFKIEAIRLVNRMEGTLQMKGHLQPKPTLAPAAAGFGLRRNTSKYA